MPEEEEGISLRRIFDGMLQSLRNAKYLGDLESVKLLDVYSKEKALSSFTVPAFTISDVEVELRFAVAEATAEENAAEGILDLKVNISPASLKELGAHQISVMKFRISPVAMRVLEPAG